MLPGPIAAVANAPEELLELKQDQCGSVGMSKGWVLYQGLWGGAARSHQKELCRSCITSCSLAMLLSLCLTVPYMTCCAEDTNQYGQDRRDGKGLAELLRELGKLEGLRWIRIL